METHINQKEKVSLPVPLDTLANAVEDAAQTPYYVEHQFDDEERRANLYKKFKVETVNLQHELARVKREGLSAHDVSSPTVYRFVSAVHWALRMCAIKSTRFDVFISTYENATAKDFT